MIDLKNGDCLELMKDIPTGSVDMILADLPYGTTEYKWDCVVPFIPLWEQLNRVIKNNGAVLVFGSEPFATTLRMSNIENYKYDWIWHKSTVTGFTHAKNMPLKDYENICIFSHGSIGHSNLLGEKRMVYNPQNIEQSGKMMSLKRKDGGIVGNRPSHKEQYQQEFCNYPRMVINFKKEKSVYHPTQKPVALLEYLIKTYTNPGETVLDPVMGSGSTGVACINTGRNFIGIEKDEHYFQVAKERIEA